MPGTVLFDVNETLVDLAALDEAFAETFGDAGTRAVWFQAVLGAALRITAAESYAPLAEIAAAALDDLAEQRGQSLRASTRDALLGGLRRLPAHSDAAPALQRLQDAGFQLAALTNSGIEAGREKLRHAGLAHFLEAVFSAEAVERLKPAPAPYRHAAQRLGIEPEDCWFVAAHDWDVDGAARAGCTTAFVARAGKRIGPLVEPPSVHGPGLEAVVEQIIAEGT